MPCLKKGEKKELRIGMPDVLSCNYGCDTLYRMSGMSGRLDQKNHSDLSGVSRTELAWQEHASNEVAVMTEVATLQIMTGSRGTEGMYVRKGSV